MESCWQGEKPRAGVACKVVRLRNAEVAAEGVTEPDGRFGLWVAPREERYMLMVEESRVLLPEESTADLLVSVRFECGASKEAAISIDAVEGDQRPGVELGPPTPASSGRQARPAGARR